MKSLKGKEWGTEWGRGQWFFASKNTQWRSLDRFLPQIILPNILRILQSFNNTIECGDYILQLECELVSFLENWFQIYIFHSFCLDQDSRHGVYDLGEYHRILEITFYSWNVLLFQFLKIDFIWNFLFLCLDHDSTHGA